MSSSRDDAAAKTTYRMPAEWEPHEGSWLSWPHNVETWPEELPYVEAAFTAVVEALAPHEAVHINVRTPADEQRIRGLLGRSAPPEQLFFHLIPTNDAWVRDHGAIFVYADAGAGPERAATVWEYNCWGGKYPPWDDDNAAAARMAEALGAPRIDYPMVLEGGSIEVDGAGLLLTTEQCLLHPNRNPHLGRAAIEETLCAAFGVSRVLWLGEGIVGDDTDGHIDDLARFAPGGRIVTALENDPGDANYGLLRENLERVRDLRTLDGRPFGITPLPMPAPLYLRGERMPATYVNYYVANEVVLMPAFGDAQDAGAAEILAEVFPGRRIAPIRCNEVIWGLGSMHCLTQQIPRRP